jgi:hypothetical protein
MTFGRTLILALGAIAFPSVCWADFSITDDFSNPVGKAGGGGGCAGDFYISKEIVFSNDSEQEPRPIAVFIRDPRCEAGPVEISIDNRSYLIEPTGKHLLGFSSAYKNAQEGIRVSIRHIRTIRKTYDKDTDCTTRYRQVAVTVQFRGMKKTLTGFVGGGCP